MRLRMPDKKKIWTKPQIHHAGAGGGWVRSPHFARCLGTESLHDSSLEGDGLEPSVPRRKRKVCSEHERSSAQQLARCRRQPNGLGFIVALPREARRLPVVAMPARLRRGCG